MKSRNDNLVRVKPTIPLMVKFLGSDDLAEMRLRVATLNNARHNFMMIEESYFLWVKKIQDKYGLPKGKFDIDQVSGEIKQKAVSNGG